MKVTAPISFLLAFLGELHNVIGGDQIALRPRPKNPILSRTIASDGSMFDPTDEESFYVSGHDPNSVIKTIHQASKRKFVNFEKFEDYLLPQKRLCTPSPEDQTTVLTFPLNREHYLAACDRWAGETKLVFIGHDPSCYAPEEERSAYKSLSIIFDDASLTIRVTGKPLRWGDRHFPAPAELIIGRAPPDVIMTRRSTSDKNGFDDVFKGLYRCVKHPRKCADTIVEALTVDIDTGDIKGSHIDFNGKDKEAHKKYWPPAELHDHTGVPELLELYCLECGTSGGMDLEFHVLFNPVSDDDNHDGGILGGIGNIFGGGDDGDEEEEKDDGYFEEEIRKHVRRAFARYHVTDEIKIRQQLEIISPVAADLYCGIPLVSLFNKPPIMNCVPAFTVGTLQWEPGLAQEDKSARAASLGKTEKGESKGKKIEGKEAWGYAVWPVDVGIYASFNIGVGTNVNLTLPGFEATVEVGSEFEVDLMGGNKDGPVNLTNFDPIIEILPMDLSIASNDIHFNMAVGPKASINMGLPVGGLGFGASIKVDLIRFDNKLSEYKNVTSACTAPKDEKEETFDNAFGFTVDLKTGIYAYLNMAGFYIDSNWIGNKVGSDFSGLYWGIKNLVARCTDCGNNSCTSEPLNDLFDSAKANLGMNGTKYRLHELEDSEHVSKDSIDSLNNQMPDEDYATGNPDWACYARAPGPPPPPPPPPPKDRRGIFAYEDVVFRRAVLDDEKPPIKCQPGGKAKL